MSNRKINCIVLDDEPMAVKLLEDYVRKCAGLNLVYAGTEIYYALEKLQEEKVQLIILDIQMPQLSGMELMKLLGNQYDYIICSAYSDYAIASYQFQVVDYLLKPISFERFFQSILKYNLWRKIDQKTEAISYLQVRADRKDYRLAFSEIQVLEGFKDYVCIHLAQEKLLVLETMKEIQDRLPDHQFIRIHRSYILSKAGIRSLEGNQVRHANGLSYPIGETYKDALIQWFKQ